MNTKNRNHVQYIISILCLIIVITVIILSFVYRNEIESFATISYMGVFVACFASTATILLPAPGILVVLRYAQVFNPVVIVLLGGIGTAVGEMVGFLLGWSGNELMKINKEWGLFSWFTKHPNIMVFLFSMIPFPVFDIVGITAGATKMNPLKFLGLCAIGKTIKMAAFVMFFNLIVSGFPFLHDLLSSL